VLEVIQPYRRLTQEIRPVVEEIHTVVSKASDQSVNQQQQYSQQQMNGGGGGNNNNKYQSPVQYMGQMSTLQSQSVVPSSASSLSLSQSTSPFSSSSLSSSSNMGYSPAGSSQATSGLMNGGPSKNFG